MPRDRTGTSTHSRVREHIAARHRIGDEDVGRAHHAGDVDNVRGHRGRIACAIETIEHDSRTRNKRGETAAAAAVDETATGAGAIVPHDGLDFPIALTGRGRPAPSQGNAGIHHAEEQSLRIIAQEQGGVIRRRLRKPGKRSRRHEIGIEHIGHTSATRGNDSADALRQRRGRIGGRIGGHQRVGERVGVIEREDGSGERSTAAAKRERGTDGDFIVIGVADVEAQGVGRTAGEADATGDGEDLEGCGVGVSCSRPGGFPDGERMALPESEAPGDVYRRICARRRRRMTGEGSIGGSCAVEREGSCGTDVERRGRGDLDTSGCGGKSCGEVESERTALDEQRAGKRTGVAGECEGSHAIAGLNQSRA